MESLRNMFKKSPQQRPAAQATQGAPGALVALHEWQVSRQECFYLACVTRGRGPQVRHEDEQVAPAAGAAAAQPVAPAAVAAAAAAQPVAPAAVAAVAAALPVAPAAVAAAAHPEEPAAAATPAAAVAAAAEAAAAETAPAVAEVITEELAPLAAQGLESKVQLLAEQLAALQAEWHAEKEAFGAERRQWRAEMEAFSTERRQWRDERQVLEEEVGRLKTMARRLARVQLAEEALDEEEDECPQQGDMAGLAEPGSAAQTDAAEAEAAEEGAGEVAGFGSPVSVTQSVGGGGGGECAETPVAGQEGLAARQLAELEATPMTAMDEDLDAEIADLTDFFAQPELVEEKVAEAAPPATAAAAPTAEAFERPDGCLLSDMGDVQCWLARHGGATGAEAAMPLCLNNRDGLHGSSDQGSEAAAKVSSQAKTDTAGPPQGWEPADAPTTAAADVAATPCFHNLLSTPQPPTAPAAAPAQVASTGGAPVFTVAAGGCAPPPVMGTGSSARFVFSAGVEPCPARKPAPCGKKRASAAPAIPTRTCTAISGHKSAQVPAGNQEPASSPIPTAAAAAVSAAVSTIPLTARGAGPESKSQAAGGALQQGGTLERAAAVAPPTQECKGILPAHLLQLRVLVALEAKVAASPAWMKRRHHVGWTVALMDEWSILHTTASQLVQSSQKSNPHLLSRAKAVAKAIAHLRAQCPKLTRCGAGAEEAGDPLFELD